MGHVVRGGGEQADVRRVPAEMSEHTQDPPGQTLGSARQPGDQLSHQDVGVVRVRETSHGRRMGRHVPGRQNQRYTVTADIVPAVPAVSALLPAARGPFQRQVPSEFGKRRETNVEAHQRAFDQLQGF